MALKEELKSFGMFKENLFREFSIRGINKKISYEFKEFVDLREVDSFFEKIYINDIPMDFYKENKREFEDIIKIIIEVLNE